MLTLYNTLLRKKERFKPLLDSKVGFYSCGPTVYNFAHIGNLRTYVFEDILKRILKYNGFKVDHVMNITDIDDKTIRDSQAAGKSLKEFTEFYTETFLNDLTALNILLPDKMPKATEHIDDMVKIIKALMDKGYAYKADDKSIYFDISKFKDYGKLAQLEKQNLKKDASGRLFSDEYQKEEASDFVLWKAYSTKDGDVFWENELGRGRPGWHIECSAMSTKYLGDAFDIHAGAEDLVFPHHTNEIAQAEAATGKKFVNYWIHGAFLTIDKKKMAKSDGNIIVLKDIIEKEINPLAYRYLILTAHYRSILNFSWDSLKSAQSALNNLNQAIVKYSDKGKVNKEYEKQFLGFINDDMDMPKATALIWQLIKDKEVLDQDKKATILKFDLVLGLGLNKLEKEKVPKEIEDLAKQREKARKDKDWEKSDKIRKEVEERGWRIEDTDKGSLIKKI